MGIIVLGTAIAASVTSSQVQDLKRQINQIITRHQALTKQVNRLAQTLKKLDLAYVSKKLQAMNDSLGHNLKTIIGDQQLKLEMINNIDPERIGFDPKSLFAKIMEIIQLIGTIILLIQFMCATNPATIAISGILLIVDFVFSVIAIINNIKTIEELKKKKAELEEFFKKGGEYEQQVNAMADLSFQVIEGFYVFTVNFKSLINELAANVNLLSLTETPENSTGLNYQYYLDLLRKNPFNQAFELDCLNTYRSFIYFQSYPLERRVNMSCKYLEEFERRHDLPRKINLAGDIASNFSQNSPLGKYLGTASFDATKLTELKNRYQNGFKRRLTKSVEELKLYDKDLLDQLLYMTRNMPNQQLNVIQVVAFYTRKFYADDPTGVTLMGRNLQQMWQMTENLSNLGVNSSHQNIIYLPEPSNSDLKKQWNANRAYLENLYRIIIGHGNFQFKRMFIRMEAGQFQLQNQMKSRLNYFYGILVRQNGASIDEYFEVPASKIFELNQTYAAQKVEPKAVKIQRMEETNENLNSLCSYVWFFINGIAYPERVTNLSITKVDNKYKAVLEWKEETQDSEIFGKFLDFSVSELPAENQIPKPGPPVPEERIFWKQTMPESNSKVVFKFL